MWRKEPPTIEEVKQNRYWWNRHYVGDQAVVLELTIRDNQIFWESGFDDGPDPLDPDDWGEEWTPCLPPV